MLSSRPRTRRLDREKYVLRAWLFVAVQAAAFTLVILRYRDLQARYPEVFDTNQARLLMPLLAGLLVLQLVIVIIYDLRTVRLRQRNRRIRERLERTPEPLPPVTVEEQLQEEGYTSISQLQKRPSADVVWYEPNRD